MTQTPVAPPRFAGLVWNDNQAPASDRFWSLYRYQANTGKITLARAGITASKVDGVWTVLFNPLVAGDKAADIVSTLELSVFAIRPKSQYIIDADQVRAEEQAKVREEKDTKRAFARRVLVERFGDMADAELVAAAQAEGRKIWQQWHSFCVQKRRLLDFSATDARISLTQALWLMEIVDLTAKKAATQRETLVARDDAVDWSDAEVVRAVEFLTTHDSDQASVENGLGWSKADSSKGHWCAGMIRNGGADRSIGIDAARAVVGKYASQMQRGEAA